MENKSLIGKILAAIIGAFSNNWKSFTGKLFNKIPYEIKNKISIGIRVVEKMKTWLGGDTAQFITHVIPGDLDEEIRLKLIDLLDKILAIDKDIDYLGKFDLNASKSHAIASEINTELTGLSFGQSALTTEVVYQNI